MKATRNRRAGHSIARRLTLGTGIVGLSVFVVVAALLQWTLGRQLERMRAEGFAGKADVVQHFLDEVDDASGLRELKHHLDDVLIGDGKMRIWLVSRDGTVLYGGRVPSTRDLGGGRLAIQREDGVALSGRAFPVEARGPIPAGRLLIGIDARGDEQLLQRYLGALTIVCGLGVAGIAGLGAWVARRELRPVRALSREAAAISPASLAHRLSTTDVALELQDLAIGFNAALARVQQAYEQLEAFSADAAHELRTPLAVMTSATEVALKGSRSADELREALITNLEATREMAAMVNDMLFLARADRGATAEALERIDIVDVARQVAEFYEAALGERGQQIDIRGEAFADANPGLLKRAIANLVSNASRHAQDGETLVLEVHRGDNEVRIAACNPGRTIDAAAMPRVFERFFRADAARHRADDRHGLGLAIVRAVALMHGGTTFAMADEANTIVGFTIAKVRTSATSARQANEQRLAPGRTSGR